MQTHDASEIAYKNGYEKGVKDIISDIDSLLYKHFNRDISDDDLYKYFARIKAKHSGVNKR